jgi:hypothetical protein
MKTAVIALICLAAIVATLMIARRRQPLGQDSPLADESLRSYLAQGGDYRFFIGMPLHAPTEWSQADAMGQALFLAGQQLDLDAVTAFLVVYPNGEILSAGREFFPLPEGVRFVEATANPKQDILDLSVLDEGRTFVTITFGPSASRPSEPGYYSTTIHNISDQSLRVTRFAAFTKVGQSFRLSTITGDYFSADQFMSWYGAPQDGWIPPGGIVADPNNYGSGDGYWVYYFETEDGRTFAAGARIPKT